MPDILLTTINARYAHSSIALRYLYANLGDLKQNAGIREFVLGSDPRDNAEILLREPVKIIGISVSIWNAAESASLVKLLKRISPETVIVLGGPEVSHEPLRLDFSDADYIIRGEGETVFCKLCGNILDDKAPDQRIITAEPLNPNDLCLPYPFYTDHDLANRVVYVETSRGCPYSCEFCLSSIDKKVRYFDLDRVLNAFEELWQRGARHFKFIDRTFNLDPKRAARIMDFFLQKEPTYLIHFEVVPDRFPEILKDRLSKFPPASLQLEVGIQTLDPRVASRINRKIEPDKIRDNLRFLEEKTNAHLHTDLIFGLPGETVAGFGRNLDTLLSWTTAEVQLGILKKLSGTTLDRHDQEYGIIWSPRPPYDIIKSNLIPFGQMQELKRLAKYWDLVYNRGNFNRTVQLLFEKGRAFDPFLRFSKWLYKNTGSTHSIALNRLARMLFDFLIEKVSIKPADAAQTIAEDLQKATGKTPPPFLREYLTGVPGESTKTKQKMNRRQQKHLQ